MANKIRVIIADDHAILRNGLRWMIGSQEDMEVVGEAGDFAAAVFLASSLEADVMTLDLTMPAGTASLPVATPPPGATPAVGAALSTGGELSPDTAPSASATAIPGAASATPAAAAVSPVRPAPDGSATAGAGVASTGRGTSGVGRGSGSTGGSGGSGVATIARVLAQRPNLRIIVLTMHDDPAYCRSVLAAGASGYLVKSAADSELITAIRAVHSGGVFVDMQTSSASADGGTTATGERLVVTGKPVEGGKLSTLSARESEVLVMVAQGHTNQAIADKLGLSVKTVESYRARLMEKLGLANRAELTQFALDLGLVGEGTARLG